MPEKGIAAKTKEHNDNDKTKLAVPTIYWAGSFRLRMDFLAKSGMPSCSLVSASAEEP